MTSIENGPTGTSSGRRWWSIAIGSAVFLVLLLAYQALLNRIFGPSDADQLTSGFALLEVVGGFISGFIGATCGRLIASDMDKKMLVYVATAALVIVTLIMVAGISNSPAGFTFNAALVALALVIPGFIGLRAGAR